MFFLNVLFLCARTLSYNAAFLLVSLQVWCLFEIMTALQLDVPIK